MSRDIFVPPRRELSGRFFHRYIIEGASASECIVDLSGAKWADPAGLVMTAAFVDRQLKFGRTVFLKGPTEPSVAHYMARMRLGHLIDELGGEHDLAPVNENVVESQLLEVTKFTDETDVDRLAEVALNSLDKRAPKLADPLYGAICEIGINVPQHSGKAYGFMAAQETHRSTRVKFAVADSGMGMFKSLQPLGLETEAQAVEMALTEGVSGTGDPTRGMGLPTARRLLTGAGGSLFLASGNTMRTAYKARMSRERTQARIRGTVIQGEIRSRPFGI